jgi:hypothetical protein
MTNRLDLCFALDPRLIVGVLPEFWSGLTLRSSVCQLNPELRFYKGYKKIQFC